MVTVEEIREMRKIRGKDKYHTFYLQAEKMKDYEPNLPPMEKN